MGIAIAARPYDEVTMFRAAHEYQRRTDHHTAMPPLVGADSDGRHPPAIRPSGIVEHPVVTGIKDHIW